MQVCIKATCKSRRYWHLRNCCVSSAFVHHDYFYEALRQSFVKAVKAGFSVALRKSRLSCRCQYRRLLQSFSAASVSCTKAAEKLAFFRKGSQYLWYNFHMQLDFGMFRQHWKCWASFYMAVGTGKVQSNVSLTFSDRWWQKSMKIAKFKKRTTHHTFLKMS